MERALAAIAAGDLHLELIIGRQFADQIAPVAEGKAYHQSVFINCPFDDDYKPLFQAMVFTVIRCGYLPRCAKEQDDSSDPRLEKILAMIEECRFGIHDLSRVEGDPRFNMPFELGLFIGAKRYGRGAQDRKSFVVFERDPHGYDKFISDFSGHDTKFHNNQEKRIVQEIRDWIPKAAGKKWLPGGHELWLEYREFKSWLKSKCETAGLRVKKLTWAESLEFAVEWKRHVRVSKRLT